MYQNTAGDSIDLGVLMIRCIGFHALDERMEATKKLFTEKLPSSSRTGMDSWNVTNFHESSAGHSQQSIVDWQRFKKLQR